MSAYTQVYLKALRLRAMCLHNDVRSVHHITPYAYCVARPAAYMAVFAVPPADYSTPTGEGFVVVQNRSAGPVGVGQWWALAYIVREGVQEMEALEQV